jgi:hypothetical protein
MFKLRKREDYLNPSTTVTQLDLEYPLAASDVRFDATIEDYNVIEGTAPEEGEVDYLS